VAERGGALDRRAVRARFERAARSYAGASRLEAEIGARMLERLDYVKLAPRRVLDAGCGPGREQRALARRYAGAQLVALDVALGALRAGGRLARLLRPRRALALCADFERLPLAAGCVQLVWSNMALHWARDPLAVLREFHRVLAGGGLLMFSTLGPDALAGLRAAAGEARVHRFADMHDLGDMLVAVGFAAPVMDTERLTVSYPGADRLLGDLRASGQTCALEARPRGLAGRGFFSALKEGLARQVVGGRLPVTYEVIYGHAWRAQAARDAEGRAIVRFERAPRA
jgi:malonyl-CoA O-methyltransferase